MARSRFKMSRSRSQIATAYAPGAFFTFEGGSGACVAVPNAAPAANLSSVTQNQIYEQIAEYVDVWERHARARDTIYRGQGPDVPITLALDRSLIGPAQIPMVSRERFEFLAPLVMGYVPDPATFVCRDCGLVKPMKDVNAVHDQRDSLAPGNVTGCINRAKGQPCGATWEQLDVVWVHWSGDYAPITPEVRQISEGRVYSVGKCKICEHEHFRLVRNGPQFKDWYFECGNQGCRTRRELAQTDVLTLKQIGERCLRGDDGHIKAELNMLPVSYRASQSYYVHGDRLLVFDENRWIDLLKGSRAAELKAFLGDYYRYQRTTLDDATRERLVRAAGRDVEWETYRTTRDTIEGMRRSGANLFIITTLEEGLRKIEEGWEKEVFGATGSGSAVLDRQAENRSAWVRRYDPIRLAVEHKTLDFERLSSGLTGQGGLPVCTRLDAPDRHMIPNGFSAVDASRMNQAVRQRLDLMGIQTMSLLRDFKVCEFTFAFTRVAPYPETEQKDMRMPVRLNLFQQFRREDNAGGRHPIYTISQNNEAFYIQLNEDLVIEWLAANGLPIALAPGQRLGGALIEAFDPERFSRFVDAYRKEKCVERDAYAFVFSLLHTLSHLLIDTVSELSGLDQGSFGEHLFVPDLALVVYRRGVTLDLGNLSSMWRTYANPTNGNQVLAEMLDPMALRCGSGSLCTMRGGACPDCVMIPESSCLCGNNLLSRAFLRGHGVAHWDTDQTVIEGYFELARARMFPGAGTGGMATRSGGAGPVAGGETVF